MMLKKLVLLVLPLLYFIGCQAPDDITQATHYDRVPAPYELSAAIDTTPTGKYRVQLSWKVTSTKNLRNFEIYKATVSKRTFFVLPQSSTTTTAVDSFSYSGSDTLKMFYFVLPYGSDRFVGKASDTIYLPITK